MEYRPLGRTGVKVSPLCLGAMMFGAWGETDHDECIRIIHRALDAGINFVDTADVYSRGESEEIVGRALQGGRRDDVVLATKVHGGMGDDPNERGNSRRWIVRECENSLRRLGTDWIDLYQIHRPEDDTDVDETLGALTDLIRAGKVRYIGSSTFPASQIVEAQWVAERRGRERFVCEQPPYSALARGIEADVLPTCLRYGVGTITWSPLAMGWLSGKYRRNGDVPESRRAVMLPKRWDLSLPEDERKLDAAGGVLLGRALVWISAALSAGILGAKDGFNAGLDDLPRLTDAAGSVGHAVLTPLAHWASVWYLGIVDHDYASIGAGIGQARAAFFPLYPLLVWIASGLGGGPGPPLVAAFAVSLV